MAVKLYDYQIAAVEKMQNGCILCGGVGSGKSRTALAYYYLQNGGEPSCLTGTEEYIPMEDPPKDLYIITTARKRDTMEWEGDLSPFLLSIHKDVNLYSNLIKVDSWNNIGKYADVKNAFFIFDEQRVIGAGAWVKAFLKIAKSNHGFCYRQLRGIHGRIIFQCLLRTDSTKTEQSSSGSMWYIADLANFQRLTDI